MTLVRTVPTPEGVELGTQMLRLYGPEIDKLAALGEPDQRCSTCACRAGTVANGSPTTQMDFLKCVMEHVEFQCHEKGRKGLPCHGWLACVHESVLRGEPPKKMNWKFSDEYTAEEPHALTPR